MAMSAPSPELEAPPLKTYLEEARSGGETGLSQPRLLESGAFEALETQWNNPQSPVRHASAGATMLIDTPQGRFSCRLMMEPDRIGSMLETWRRFCASLIPADSTRDASTHG